MGSAFRTSNSSGGCPYKYADIQRHDGLTREQRTRQETRMTKKMMKPHECLERCNEVGYLGQSRHAPVGLGYVSPNNSILATPGSPDVLCDVPNTGNNTELVVEVAGGNGFDLRC